MYILPTGTFSQYDTMIYPPPESVLKQFKGVLSRQEIEKHPEIHCPSPDQMRRDCLVNYLALCEPVLKSQSVPDSASKLVSEVLHIYLQLAEHLIYADSKLSVVPSSFEPWPVDNLKNVRINHTFSVHNMQSHINKLICKLLVCIHVSYYKMTEFMDVLCALYQIC